RGCPRPVGSAEFAWCGMLYKALANTSIRVEDNGLTSLAKMHFYLDLKGNLPKIKLWEFFYGEEEALTFVRSCATVLLFSASSCFFRPQSKTSQVRSSPMVAIFLGATSALNGER